VGVRVEGRLLGTAGLSLQGDTLGGEVGESWKTERIREGEGHVRPGRLLTGSFEAAAG